MTVPPGEPTAAPSLRSLMTDKMGALAVRSGQIIVVLVLAVIVVFALVQLKLVVIPVLIALIVAAAASPIMRFLKKRGMSAIVATWLTLLAGILVIGGLITLIVFAVRNQWDTLASSAMDGLDQLQDFITTGPIPVDAEQIESAKQALIDFATSSQVGSGALAGASIVGSLATGAALAVVILFFFLKDGPSIWAFFLRPFSGHRRARGERIGATAVRVLGGYVRGTAIIAFVDAAGIGIGLAILQVPLALPLAVIVFVTAFIPIVGATAAGILAALVALVANGPVVALIVILIVVAVNQLEGNFLQPVVMAQSLKLHPLVILVALTAGTILGGITGAVLAVPIAAVGWAIVKTWNVDTPRSVVPPTVSAPVIDAVPGEARPSS
jgi:predicted PurR-regulated permease PerM